MGFNIFSSKVTQQIIETATKTSKIIVNQASRRSTGTPSAQSQYVASQSTKSVSNPVVRRARMPMPSSPTPSPVPLPNALSSIDKLPTITDEASFQIVSDVDPQQFSLESSIATYETIFDEFRLEAVPFYNFWVPDEDTNDREEQGDRKLDDMARFIKISWDPAPDFSQFFRVRDRQRDKREIEPVKFSAEVEKPRESKVKGISFLPDHLQPRNFSLVKKSLANGFIAPGIVSSVVELPIHNTGLDDGSRVVSTVPEIDEDAFLTHPDTYGIAINELKANVNQMTDGVLGACRVGSCSRLTNNGTMLRDKLFSGKFSVNRSPFNGSFLQMHSLTPSSPAMSLVLRKTMSRGVPRQDAVLDMVSKTSTPIFENQHRQSIFNKVKFAWPSIGGALSPSRLNLISSPEHVESVAAVAHAIPNLEVLAQSGISDLPRRTDVPSFPSPDDIDPIEYVGYVLQKYKKNSVGAFELVEEIDLPDREYSSYIDTKVLYGGVYRYRIRSILRWSRPSNVGPFGPAHHIDPRTGTQTKKDFSQLSSYFGGEWGSKWAYSMIIDTLPPPPPDELQVIPFSHRKTIMVTIKLPENVQRDISSMKLYRKLQDEHGRDLTGWIDVAEFRPRNSIYHDRDPDVDFFQQNGIRYVYAAQCFTRHDEVSPFSEQISARLNQDYKTRGEFPVELVSCKGVMPDSFGAFSVCPPRRTRSEVIVAPSNPDPASSEILGEGESSFTLHGRNGFGSKKLDGASFFVRVESLDTGERVTIPLDLEIELLPDRVSNLASAGSSVYVPPRTTFRRNFGIADPSSGPSQKAHDREIPSPLSRPIERR